MKLEEAERIVKEIPNNSCPNLGIPIFCGVVGDVMASFSAAVNSYVEPRTLGEISDNVLLGGAKIGFGVGAALVGLGVIGIHSFGRLRQASETVWKSYEERQEEDRRLNPERYAGLLTRQEYRDKYGIR